MKETNVKSALLDLKKIQDFMKESTEDFVKPILEGAVQKGLKKILSEAAFDVEDAEDDNKDIEGVEDTDSTEDAVDNVEIEEPATDDVDINVDVDGAETDLGDESGEEEDFDIDQFKSDDGEYDLTNADTDSLIKVFKRIDKMDNVFITDMGDGKIDLKDGETGVEYVIDTTGGDDIDVEPEVEIDLDDEEPVVTESKHECYTKEDELTEDDQPEVGPDTEGEGMVDEKNMTQSYGTNRRAGVLSQTRAANAPGANKRNGGQLVGESKEVKALKLAYNKKIAAMNEEYDAFKQSTTKDMNELKSVLGQFVTTIKENAVVNNSLGKVVKLIIENTTTKDEKAAILNRFATEAKTIEAGNTLFESIKKELSGKVGVNTMIDKQFGAGGSKAINEQVIYQNKDLTAMQELMRKMDKL